MVKNELTLKKQQLMDELVRYEEWFPEDHEVAGRFREFIRTNDNLFGRDNAEGHITCSAWIVNRDHSAVLLTYHRSLKKWVQTGGHIDPGEMPFEASWREGLEESGITGLSPVSREIFNLSIFPFPQGKDGKAHLHYDIRYLFVADTEDYRVSDESLELKWVELKALGKYSNEPDILAMEKRQPDFLIKVGGVQSCVDKR